MADFVYECESWNRENEAQEWQSSLTIMSYTYPYEFKIESRGSLIHVVVGTYAYGNYLCAPSLRIGCELGQIGDTFWNTESPINAGLSEADAVSVAQGLKLTRDCF